MNAGPSGITYNPSTLEVGVGGHASKVILDYVRSTLFQKCYVFKKCTEHVFILQIHIEIKQMT